MKTTDYWVYREDDESLVGQLIISSSDMGLSSILPGVNEVHVGMLTNSVDGKITRLAGGYAILYPGRVEEFGDLDSVEDIKRAVKNHPKGPYFLNPTPIIRPGSDLAKELGIE